MATTLLRMIQYIPSRRRRLQQSRSCRSAVASLEFLLLHCAFIHSTLFQFPSPHQTDIIDMFSSVSTLFHTNSLMILVAIRSPPPQLNLFHPRPPASFTKREHTNLCAVTGSTTRRLLMPRHRPISMITAKNPVSRVTSSHTAIPG